MNNTKPSASIALTILALIALELIFAQYQRCGRYHPDPYISPCQNSLASELFPNSVVYLAQAHGAALTLAANALFIAAIWLIPWFRRRSWGRTLLSVAIYVLVSAIFGFLVMYIALT